LVRYLRAKRPTIIQTWLYHADFLGTAAAVFAKPDHLLWNVRCSDIDHPGIPLSTRCLARILGILSRRPNAIVVNSQEGQRYHHKIGYHPKQWINIPNGVDLDRFHPRPSERATLRARIGLPPDSTVIGFVARYHPMKDVETFLSAASLFQQRHENVKFVLCGDRLTSHNTALTELVRRLNLERSVVLFGRRTDIELVYPTLDVLALCSVYGEGFPNVLAEAMACGVPCVATDVGDCVELIGDCGKVIPKRDPHAVAQAYGTLIEMGLQEVGARARKRMVACYGLEQMVSRYESLYRSLVGNDHRSFVNNNSATTSRPRD
jgi:glycosyltransferase involved in cell wall biosynthesis